MSAGNGRRRRFGAALLLASILAAACGGDSESENAPSGEGNVVESVRIVVNPGFSGHLPIWVASEEGIFEKHGIDAEIISSPTGATDLLISGDADVLSVSPPLPLLAIAEGHEMRILATVQDQLDQALLVSSEVEFNATPGDFPKVVRELRGMRIGINAPGGSNDFNFRFLVTAAGMDPEEDVEINYGGGFAELLAGFEAGRFDATYTPHPLTAALEESGTAKIVLSLAEGQGPEVLQQPFTALTTTAEFFEENQDLAQRLVDAMKETEEFIKDPANEDAVLELAGSRVLEGLDPNIVPDIVADVVKTMNVTLFTSADLAKVEEVLMTAGLLEEEIPAEAIIAEGIEVPN